MAAGVFQVEGCGTRGLCGTFRVPVEGRGFDILGMAPDGHARRRASADADAFRVRPSGVQLEVRQEGGVDFDDRVCQTHAKLHRKGVCKGNMH